MGKAAGKKFVKPNHPVGKALDAAAMIAAAGWVAGKAVGAIDEEGMNIFLHDAIYMESKPVNK